MTTIRFKTILAKASETFLRKDVSGEEIILHKYTRTWPSSSRPTCTRTRTCPHTHMYTYVHAPVYAVHVLPCSLTLPNENSAQHFRSSLFEHTHDFKTKEIFVEYYILQWVLHINQIYFMSFVVNLPSSIYRTTHHLRAGASTHRRGTAVLIGQWSGHGPRCFGIPRCLAMDISHSVELKLLESEL